jgi:dolichol-phosphate mannosyltransferase
MKVSVILPTYNEAENITALVHDIFAHLKDHDTEILVVDDDSPDGTWHIAEQVGSHFGRLRVVRRQKDRGLCASLADGIRLARGEIICWMDADFSMPPLLLPSLVAKVVEGADLAVGSRYAPGGSDGRDNVPLHRFLSRALTLVASRLLVPKFRDYTSGFLAARRSALEQLLPLEGDYGEYFIALVYRAFKKGFRVVEIPYVCKPRLHGGSKTATNVLGYLTRGWGYVWVILRLRVRGSLG